MSELDDLLSNLSQAMKPVFDEQRETWDREGPAAMERAGNLGITIDTIGGNCPVQAEGSFDGKHFYFRARGDAWQFHVGNEDKDIFSDDPEREWVIEEGYGSGFDAGWMPQHEAVGFICAGVERYRAR